VTQPTDVAHHAKSYDPAMDTLDDEGPVRLASGAAATAHDWDVAAAAVLRKARRLTDDDPVEAAWATLARKTVEGIIIPPLGTPDRARHGAAPGPECNPDTRAGRAIIRAESGWDIRSLIANSDPAEAAASALEDLENGATSLWVTVGGPGSAPADLALALDGVLLDLAPVVITAAGTVTDLQAGRALIDLLDTRGVSPDAGASLGADPVGRAVRAQRTFPDGRTELVATIGDISSLATTAGIRALTVDGTSAHDAGAGDAAELGFSLAVGAEYLRALETAGCDVEAAFGLLEFRYAATDDQFTTIAKFRAARGLWRRVARLSGAAASSAELFAHAVTSAPRLTRYDPWVNLLRTTGAAFAAGVGGADAVTVLPVDSRLGVPDALGRRMARNISSLLISESHVAAVDDPAGGSHAVELLTADLADAAWAEFQTIERSGGVLAALTDGSLRARWAATDAERIRRISTRRQPITGVSEFPNLRETLPSRRSIAVDTIELPASWATPFEVLRDQPAATPVFLATLGSVADHAARAGFAANLFAAGGVDTVTAGATEGVDVVLAAIRDTGSPVACVTGSDKAYAASGADVIAALRAAGATRVLLAGRPKGELAGLVDDHVAAGDDVVEFLRRTRQFLPGSEDLDETGAN
jgi:methylmalonyl-CoA mutase